MNTHWIDRATATLAPRWTLKRQRARLALAQLDVLARHYDAASSGRRTQGWRRSAGDANAVIGPALTRLREHSHELVRNNPYAESAVTTIADQAVGWGITAKPDRPNPKAEAVWKEWAETTACDADGRHDIYGLEKLVKRTVVEAGEVLVRRRFRRPEDGLPLPLQLQVLDPDFIDSSKDTMGRALPNGGQIVQGVEFDPIGRRAAYWLFSQHPGSNALGGLESRRIPASEITHVYKTQRPGQVRGVPWFAPVLLRARDLDDMEDAHLMKEKISACLTVLRTDPDGTMDPIGRANDRRDPGVDSLEPGAILNMPPGSDLKIVDPPQANEYAEYVRGQLRAIATGIGITYEDLTGDYEGLNFSAARMSRLRHWIRVEDWRWRILIPQFCDIAWDWCMQTAVIAGRLQVAPGAVWTAPPAPMIDPANEGLAYQRNIRNGLQSLSEVLRERGYDPIEVLNEMARDNALLDKLRLVLDSDPRKMTQAGQAQSVAAGGAAVPGARDDGPDMERLVALVLERITSQESARRGTRR